jgi:hypothetical protein
MGVYLCGPSSRTAALVAADRCVRNVCEMEWKAYLPRHSRAVELLFFDALASEKKTEGVFFRARDTCMVCHIHTMLYMLFSAHCPYFIYVPEFLILLQPYNSCERRRKTTDFSALSWSHSISDVYTASSDQFPCLINPLLLSIAHTGTRITETIAVKKFLWWGAQQRG